MSNTPKLKVGDTFVYTEEMEAAIPLNTSGEQKLPQYIGKTLRIERIREITSCPWYCFEGGGSRYCKNIDPFLPSLDIQMRDLLQASITKPKREVQEWTQRIKYTSKTGFKIEKDKITFPNGLSYTFEEFTKHYNQLRGVYRKLSELKKDKIF